MVDTLPPINLPDAALPWAKEVERRLRQTSTRVRQTADQQQATASAVSAANDSATHAAVQINDDRRVPAQTGGVAAVGDGYYDNDGVSRGYVTVTWDVALLGADGAEMTGVQYEVWYRNSSEPESAMRRSTTTADISTRINNLETAKVYYIQVRTLSATGVPGAFSPIVTATTAVPSTVPPAPTAPQLASSLGTVAATWDGLDSTAAPMPKWVNKVQLYVSTTAGGTYTATGPQLLKAGTVTITGLTVGSTYYFKWAGVAYTGTVGTLSASNSTTVQGIAPVDISGLTANLATMNANTANAFANANAAFAQANTASAYASSIVASSPDMFSNPGFEDDSFWTLTGSSIYSTAQSHTGLRNVITGGALGEILSPLFPTIAGTAYRVTYWVYSGSVPAGGIRVANSAGATIGGLQLALTNTGNTWQKVVYEFVIPAGVTQFRIRWASSSGTWRLDDVSLLDITDIYYASLNSEAAYDQANTATSDAANAAANAATAQSTANGKSTTYRSADAAPTTGLPGIYREGDLWFQYVGGVIVGQWRFTSGSFSSQPIDNAVIANLDAGKINTGLLSADRIGVGSLDAKVLTANTAYAYELIVPGSIVANLMDVGSVTAGAIAVGAIQAIHMDVDSVTSNAIASGNILTNHIGAGQVVTSHLAADVGGQLDISANDSVNIIVGQIGAVSNTATATADSLDDMQTFYQFGPTGAVISSPDSLTALALRNDRIEILQSGAVVSYWNAGQMFVKSFVGEEVILGNHKIEKYGTGTVVRSLS